MSTTKKVRIRTGRGIRGKIELPGDKSISHRAALLAAMAEGTSIITNFATNMDCLSTLSCLAALGVEIERSGSAIKVKGVGKNGFREPSGVLDCGNSGTTMRLLAGILAGQNFDSVLDGDDSLRSRPMARVIEPLTAMGAAIDAENGTAPLRVSGRNPLNSIEYRPRSASAQIKSCVLLSGLNAGGITTVIEGIPTRDHTECMLREFGADVDESVNDGVKRISVNGDSKLSAANITVPADISAAAFFIAAAACMSDSEMQLENVGLNPSRRAAIDVMIDAGADIRFSNLREISGEPVGDLKVFGRPFAGTGRKLTLDGGIIANLIDEIPILAVLGTQLPAGLEVRGAAELRVKESDRIKAVVENLRRMDAAVEEFPDGFRVERSRLKGAAIDPFGDHRIAMAFAIAGLFAEGQTEILSPECVQISFPGFFHQLELAVRN